MFRDLIDQSPRFVELCAYRDRYVYAIISIPRYLFLLLLLLPVNSKTRFMFSILSLFFLF